MIIDAIEVRGVDVHCAIRVGARYALAKRALDIVLVLLILVPASVVMILTAVAVRLESDGPILFRQRRVGMNGSEFEMLKFRSMYHNSDQGVHQAAFARYVRGEKLNSEHAAGPQYKLVGDKRITRVGKFIRKTSIDELPQLINILKGEMSLVGPRPALPYELKHYGQHHWHRLSGKPGLTGMWQVYGRGHATFEEMMNFDISYLGKQSIMMDLKLIALTVLVVFNGRGGA